MEQGPPILGGVGGARWAGGVRVSGAVGERKGEKNHERCAKVKPILVALLLPEGVGLPPSFQAENRAFLSEANSQPAR